MHIYEKVPPANEKTFSLSLFSSFLIRTGDKKRRGTFSLSHMWLVPAAAAAAAALGTAARRGRRFSLFSHALWAKSERGHTKEREKGVFQPEGFCGASSKKVRFWLIDYTQPDNFDFKLNAT